MLPTVTNQEIKLQSLVPDEGANVTISNSASVSDTSSKIKTVPAAIIKAHPKKKPLVLRNAKLVPIQKTGVPALVTSAPASSTSASQTTYIAAPAKTQGLTNMLWIPPNTPSDSINAVQSILCQALKIDKSKLNLHAAKLHTFPFWIKP